MNQKIVFLDIDGTLANHNHVPLSAQRACRTARQNGHLLYICTGRPRVQISRRILKMGFDGVVSSGGAYIETTSPGRAPTLLFHASLEKKILYRLRDYFNARQTPYLLELPGKVCASPYLKSYFDTLYTGMSWSPRIGMERFFIHFFFRHLIQGEIDSQEDVCKVVFMEFNGLTFEAVQQEFGGECELFRNSIPIQNMKGGEISPRGVHKGAALERVIAYHGIPRENAIAIGDSDNDRTMLECAGVGIAMGNADEALKQIADDVTDTSGNAGLAKAFKKYGLV
ncbi:MAG: Cof-type HAD-IIB family hydrolase [Treponema sp.]|jgi:Cof subfamily protein (haloacid dehalogenase superfamily)|nr:Cof-type HAD-IIB family hydrolase [Treponema sp.]